MKLAAVILDWAGTTIDHGSCAPVSAIRETFEQFGVPVTAAEVRQGMGLLKRDHVQTILMSERVTDAWNQVFGKRPDYDDAGRLYERFSALQSEIVPAHSDLISGTVEAIDRMRLRGLKIGSTTGYTRAMLQPLLASAARQGYIPDCSVCPNEVGGGRPFPWMCFSNAIQLKLSRLCEAVKIGDTVADIEEGLNAGMWSVGITRTGNSVGLSEDDWRALSPKRQNMLLDHASDYLLKAGAHYVIESLNDIDPVLDLIDARLGQGEKP